MADVFVREHKFNKEGTEYNNIYRVTKAKAVETESGESVETKLAAAAEHIADTSNPHNVTADQVGADVQGSAASALADAKKYTDQKIADIPTPDVSGQIETHNTSGTAHADIRAALDGKENAGAASAVQAKLDAHTKDKANPHGVTAMQVPYTPTADGAIKDTNVQKAIESLQAADAATNEALATHKGDTTNPHKTTAAQVGARPDTWMPTAAEVGARPSTWTPSAADVGAVPTDRKVNNKPLSADVTLTAGDVGADAAGAATTALDDAKKYADQKVIDMVTAPAGGTMEMAGGIGAGPYTFEFTPDEDGALTALDVAYENGTSGMKATNVQAAVDELHETVQNAGGKPKSALVTLSVAGWDASAKTQSVAVPGVLADESKQLILPMPATANQNAYAAAGIACTAQAANSLTFTAQTVPTEAIKVYVVVQDVTPPPAKNLRRGVGLDIWWPN